MTNEQRRINKINESVMSMAKTKESYAKFLKKRSFNIKNKVAPSHIILDSKGYRI